MNDELLKRLSVELGNEVGDLLGRLFEKFPELPQSMVVSFVVAQVCAIIFVSAPTREDAERLIIASIELGKQEPLRTSSERLGGL